MSKAQVNYFLVLATIFVLGFFLSVLYISSKIGARVMVSSVPRVEAPIFPDIPEIPKAPKMRDPLAGIPKITKGIPVPTNASSVVEEEEIMVPATPILMPPVSSEKS